MVPVFDIGKFVTPEFMDRMRQLVSSKTTNDTFGNCNIDLSSCKEFDQKECARAAKALFSEIFTNEAKNQKHMLTLKLAPTQTRLHKYALDAGMSIHHADPQSSWIVKCLKNHDAAKCTYPKYKTAIVGISGVVFSADMTKFLAVKEISGPYRGWKAPTGAVDYEKGENPLEAAVREISEETKLSISSRDAVFVGAAWTKNFRGNSPDVNYVFACKCKDETQQLKAQEEEIAKVQWISYAEFMKTPAIPPVAAGTETVNAVPDAEFLIKKVVEAAYDALKSQSGWSSKDLKWASGKPVTFLSHL
jgi:ADP-ribose pyrophosphatase YjhB (NUDIX family)